MDGSEIHLSDAIRNLGKDTFPDTLRIWLSKCIDFDNIATLAYFQDRPPIALMYDAFSPIAQMSLEKTYLTGAYLLDPFHDLHTQNAPAGLYQLKDIAPDHFMRNRYFRDYYQNTGMIDELVFTAYPAKGVSVHVCLGRDQKSGNKFAQRATRNAARIAPIVTALVESHWTDLNTSGQYNEQDLIANLIQSAQHMYNIKLSPRQAQVAILILRGHSSVSIGLRLDVSAQTVKVFRKQLYKKCEISSQVELFSLFLPLLGSTN
jgi:DNA-binding CsgD family transcriptional regulator